MMIDVGWGDAIQQYYVLVIRGRWTSSEMEVAIETIYSEIEQRQHSVHIIIDVRYAVSPPLDIINLFSKSIQAIPNNVDRIVLINKNAIWLRLYEILKRIYGTNVARIHFVRTVSDAYQLVIPDESSPNDLASGTV